MQTREIQRKYNDKPNSTSRPIRFRAWDKQEKKMVLDIQKCPDYCEVEFCFGDYLNQEWYEVMQYTGLKDKNGKEIYEGDILSNVGWGDGKLVVQLGWIAGQGYMDVVVNGMGDVSDDTWGWGGEPIGYVGPRVKGKLHSLSWDGAEVVGNIWENPELIK